MFHDRSSLWKGYLAKQMQKVFGDYLSSDQIALTGLLYERFLARTNEQPAPLSNGVSTKNHNQMKINPTPREINKLINLIASLCLQWNIYLQDKSLSFGSVCYYAINKKEIDNDLLSVLGAKQNDGIILYAPDWHKEVSALHFGCELDEAMQLLLGDQINAAVASGDKEMFFNLIEKYHGAEEVCRKAIEYICSASEPEEELLVKSAYLMGQSSGTRQSDPRAIAPKETGPTRPPAPPFGRADAMKRPRKQRDNHPRRNPKNHQRNHGFKKGEGLIVSR